MSTSATTGKGHASKPMMNNESENWHQHDDEDFKTCD